MRKTLLIGGILLSAALIWFAVSNYQSARPIAEENLHGLALSLTAAIENISLHDPTMRNLSTFQTHDIAFFALIDKKGVYRFHTNPDLIGTPFQRPIPLAAAQDAAAFNQRITLRTGENVYEFNAPIYLPGETLTLQLMLHTYRADTVIRRARLNMMVLFALLVAGWMLALVLYRFTRREEQHHMEMARQESLAQLGEMGAMLAHEIRNPLAGIKGYAQVIEKKPLDERNGGFAHRIVTEILRLEALVSDLLAYARTDKNSMTTVDICEVIAKTASLLSYEAEQLKIKIIRKCPEGTLITGNMDRVGQALLNLGKNSIQAMPEGGTLLITAGVTGKRLIIQVCDDGDGISQEEMRRIFEPFYTTKARGTGLGLALCKRIAEEHDGEITVQSVIGEGTSVSISIPIRQNTVSRS